MTDESVTFQEVEVLCEQMAQQRGLIDKISQTKKEADQVLAEQEKKLLVLFEKLGKTSYQSKVGTFGITHRTSVKIPGTPEAKAAFFGYLKEKGIFENMATIHSATLNSFWKAEFEAAKEQGNGMDFELPGVEPPTINQIITFKAAK